VNQTVKRAEKELLPSRPCTSCGEHFEASHLTWVGGQWFCTDCHLEWKAQHETPPQYVNEATAEVEAASGTLVALKKVDNFFRVGSGLLRFAGYAIAFYLARTYSFVDPFLQGIVLADVLTWIVLCWFGRHFTKLSTILEFVGFVILTTIIVSHGDSMFDSNTSMGIAFLGFLATLGTKGLYQVHRLWSGSGTEPE